MANRQDPEDEESVARYADLLAAIGTEPRLRILRMLLRAHPDGLVVGEIIKQLPTTPSTLSHHLDKLRQERLVTVQRQGTYLRYRADTDTLRDLLTFFYAECCGRNAVIDPGEILRVVPSGGPRQAVGTTTTE